MDFIGTFFFIAVITLIIWLKIRFADETSGYKNLYTTYDHLSAVSISLKGQESWLRELFEKESYYFRTLSRQKQDEFVLRCIRFNSSTSFYSGQGFVLEPRHIALISGTFVQLTFGLTKSLLDHFNHIQVYPAHYRNDKTQRLHKGDIDITGLISLSWEDFQEGNVDQHDGRNVGLHEMAHAFAIEIIESGMMYHHLLMQLQPIYLRARKEINNPYERSGLLREYAYSNMHEYFAVATEMFFEKPEPMANLHPSLYNAMAKLYHQDILTQYRQHELGLSNNQKPNTTQQPPV